MKRPLPRCCVRNQLRNQGQRKTQIILKKPFYQLLNLQLLLIHRTLFLLVFHLLFIGLLITRNYLLYFQFIYMNLFSRCLSLRISLDLHILIGFICCCLLLLCSFFSCAISCSLQLFLSLLGCFRQLFNTLTAIFNDRVILLFNQL